MTEAIFTAREGKDAWSFRIPAQPSDKLACPFCDGNGHRCDHCDGNGWLLAEDAPERPQEPRVENFDAR